jgi:hypothetical protein
MKKIIFTLSALLITILTIAQPTPSAYSFKGISTPGNYAAQAIFGVEYRNTNLTGYSGVLTTVGKGPAAGVTTVWGTQPNGQGYIWNSKGVILPRLSTLERTAIIAPNEGTIIWNTTTHALNFYNGSAWNTTTGNLTGPANLIPYMSNTGNVTYDVNFSRDSATTQTIIFTQSITGDTTGGIFVDRNDGVGLGVVSSLDTTYLLLGPAKITTETRAAGIGKSFIDMQPDYVNLGSKNALEDTTILLQIDTNAITFSMNNQLYSFPIDTGSPGQFLAVENNNGTGGTNLSWQSTLCDTIILENQTTSIALTNINGTGTEGGYHLNFYLLNSVTDLGPSNVILNINWNDGTARTKTATLDLTAGGYQNHITGTTTTEFIYNKGPGEITFATTFTAVGLAAYTLIITAEKVY